MDLRNKIVAGTASLCGALATGEVPEGRLIAARLAIVEQLKVKHKRDPDIPETSNEQGIVGAVNAYNLISGQVLYNIHSRESWNVSQLKATLLTIQEKQQT